MLPEIEIRSAVDVVVWPDGGCRPATDVEVEAYARIADLEAALRKINALIDSPARFNAEVQAVLDSVIDTSDTKF